MVDEAINDSADQSEHFKKWVIIEHLIFLSTGVTSFLSLIFIPRSVPYFLSISILNGIFGVCGGAFGLYFGFKECLKLLKVVWVFLAVILVLNIIGTGNSFYLLIMGAVYDKPDCSECKWDNFYYAAHIIYFIVQIFADLFLAYLAFLGMKHALRFKQYKVLELNVNPPT